MTKKTDASLCDALEALIDKHGLLDVVTGLELVCMDKANHIRLNWQDNGLARVWRAAEKKFQTLAYWVESKKVL